MKMKMKIEIDVEMPEGYEATGDYRYPRYGEHYINECGQPIECHPRTTPPMAIILRKKALTGKAWVDSLPNGTVFMCGSLAYQKCSGDSFAVGATDPEWDKEWSDATCKIIYRPEPQGEEA